MPATIVRILRSIRSCTATSKLRTVPRNTTSCGITFQVSPPWTCVTLTTPASSGCRFRATIVCSALMACAANSIGSLAGVRHGRVRAFAGGNDLEDVERAHERPDARRERAEGFQRPVVHAVHRAHRKPLEEALLDHHPAAALVLFRRLKYEIDGAVEILLPGERRRRAQQHRRVAVVTASVHLALDLRSVRGAGFLVDVQRVEVGAQADRVSAGSAAKHADDAGLRESGVHLEPERAQLVGDERARSRLLERGLRVRVNMVSPGPDFGNECRDFGNDGHGSSA